MLLNWDNEKKNLALYIGKCVTGWLLVYAISKLINYPDYMWCLISVILVLSPDENEAMNLALARIKANLVGGAISLLCLLLGPASIWSIALAFALAIVACELFKIMTASRTALAAVIIVMTRSSDEPHLHLWSVTLERILSVIAGCVLGLLITAAFHRKLILTKAILGDSKGDE